MASGTEWERAGDLDRMREALRCVVSEISRVIVGHEDAIDQILITVLAGGHALLEAVPGLGKTLMVQTAAAALGLEFSRVQFTPDLMPGDITGTHVLKVSGTGERAFEFEPGPIFAQLVLADEINRATPKTQSALLEAMQERQVTAAGKRFDLPSPFVVLATQNPIEMEGTYRLPEAQIDRFLFKIVLTFPGSRELEEIVDRTTASAELQLPPAVVQASEVAAMRRAAREVPIASHVKKYALRIVEMSHPTAADAPAAVRKYVRYGISPRGAQALVLAGKARALLVGRNNASVEDIRAVALPALRHRLHLNFAAQTDGVTAEEVVEDVIAQVDRTLLSAR